MQSASIPGAAPRCDRALRVFPLGGVGCLAHGAIRDEDAGVVAVRVLTVVVGLALGALCGIGVLVAALFERDGFGDRDGEPSTAYLLALAVGLVASFGLPLALWRMLLPSRFSWPAALTATVVAVAGVAWIVGISLAG